MLGKHSARHDSWGESTVHHPRFHGDVGVIQLGPAVPAPHWFTISGPIAARKATGDVIVIRYADDTIVGFQHEHEAKAFLHDLHERMREFELALHPAKTRLIRFGRHAAKQREELGEGKPEPFDFLGFTHFCTRASELLRSLGQPPELCGCSSTN